MEGSKTAFQQIIDQQKEIEKYKARLNDIVHAHKSLIREKEALESSLRAVINSKSDGEHIAEITQHNLSEESCVKSEEKSVIEVCQLKKQLLTLTNSLSTLSAEKSKMEASFQADKKQLRLAKESFEKMCHELKEEVQKYSSEIEDLKSKLTVEKHARDKGQHDQRVMIKELQRVVAEERASKEQLEDTLEELQISLAQEQSKADHYQKEIAILTDELEATGTELKMSKRKVNETLLLLLQLQEEMNGLRNEHQSALQDEKERARDIEERSKMLSAIYEERVASLEGKLTELSETVGTYEKIRQQDQICIQKLKDHITQISLGQIKQTMEENKYNDTDPKKEAEQLVKKILELQDQLITVNKKCEKPIDPVLIFNGYKNSLDHSSCKEDYNKLKKEYDLYRQQAPLINNLSNHERSIRELDTLQNQVKNLQDRLRILSENFQDTEREYKREIEHLKKTLKTEKERFKETLSSSETDFRGRLCLLEQQLQKQRERSLALLEEKEQEIHSLQNTFQMFLPGCRNSQSLTDETKKTNEDLVSKIQVPGSNPMKEGPHILHYANELSRRDVEIANLRRSKHLIESTLRDLQKAAINDNEKHLHERQKLREEIARLERYKSREGANLEYLKNVVLNFLISCDANSKRHMLNAIAAVLKFSDVEIEKVTKHSSNSWWGKTTLKT